MNTDIRGQALVQLWLTSERLAARAEHALGAVHGIAFIELLVLLALYRAPEQMLRRVDLARAVERTASGITRLLRPMEKIGLVRRASSERDARVSLVALTPAGEAKLLDAIPSLNGLGAQLTQVLGAAELDALQGALAKLRGL